MSEHRKKRLIKWGSATASALCLPLLLVSTDPKQLSLPLLILPFLLLFGTAFFITYFLVTRILALYEKKGHPIMVSAGIAGVPTLLLVLQSIGQLTPKDLLITGCLVACIAFYANQGGFSHAS